MPTEIKLPSLGDGIDSAEILELFVSEGDEVKAEQGLMELETDKATVTVPSPAAGKIVKLQVKEGDSVAVGQVFALLEPAGGAAPAAPKNEQPSAPEQKPAEKEAATKQPSEAAPKAESQPAAATVDSKPSPQPAAAPVGGSKDVPVPNTAASTPKAAPVQPSVQPQPQASEAAATEIDDSIAAGPAIRRFAREVGVDLSKVQGTGEYGRITREDVLNVVKQLGQQSGMAAGQPQLQPESRSESMPARPNAGGTGGPSVDQAAAPNANDDYGPIRVERMDRIRKTISAQMVKSWSQAPRVVNFDDADITDLEKFRQSSKDDYAKRGIKLTTMPFLIKAVAAALRHHPSINASIDTENEQIIYKQYVNIGIAVDTPRGLVVPTLRDVDRMPIPDIAAALGTMAERVRENNFAVSDLRGGTFTISNLGAIGGTYSTPIINVPEVAILLVGRSRKLPVVMEDDSIKPRLMMPLSLAYDHRLVDGGTAARFLNEIIGYLETPSRLLLAV